MNEERLRLLADDLWSHVYQVIDREPEYNGLDAGKVAQTVQEAFTHAVTTMGD